MDEIKAEVVEVEVDQEKREDAEAPLFSPDELDNLRVIKLTNGEDVLAVVLAIVNDQMLVRRPCKILRIPHTDGTVAVILIKWQAFSNEDKHALAMPTVIAYSRVPAQMRTFYVNSVVKQLEEEKREDTIAAGGTVEPEFEWPEWMDVPSLDKSKLN